MVFIVVYQIDSIGLWLVLVEAGWEKWVGQMR